MTTQAVVDEKYELDSPTSLRDEKKDFNDDDKDSQVIIDDKPIPERIVEEFHFTWRASIVGSLLGCVVGK